MRAELLVFLARLADRGDAATAADPLELDDDVDHHPRVGDGIEAAEAEPRLHHHQGKLFERGRRRIGVDRGERARMTRVDGSKEAYRLAPAKLAQNDAVGTKPERRLEQVFDRQPRLAGVALDRNESDSIGVCRRISGVSSTRMIRSSRGTSSQQRIEECRLAR